jgi:hypothetical protein
MIRLDRRLTLSSPASICVFCVVCGSTFLVYCPRPAQRALSDRKENGTANHAEHAKGSGALQGQDDAFDLKARLAEVEQ